MAYSQDDITTLKQAISTGAQRVRYADGREVWYRNLDDMLATLQIMSGEVAGTRPARQHSVAGF